MEGRIEAATADERMVLVKVLEHFKDRFRSLAKVQPVGKQFQIKIDVNARFKNTEPGGIILFETVDLPSVQISDFIPPRTLAQNSTLWGLCRFIGWVQEGHKPDSETVYWIYRGILDQYSPQIINPNTNEREPMTSSHPGMNVKVMSRLIEGALAVLLSQDIPTNVEEAIGKEMRDLWRSFYEWRYRKNEDLLEDFRTDDWEEYCDLHPVCEACGMKHSDDNPLERAHIVSAGADKTVYEESWNWLRIHHNHHFYLQHGQGWSEFLKAFPHLESKVEHAHLQWHKAQQGELNVEDD